MADNQTETVAHQTPEYKVILLGEPGCGKSTVFNAVQEITADGTFRDVCLTEDWWDKMPHHADTDMCSCMFNVNGKRAKINLWDTAGMEKYRSLTSSYYHRASACIFVYSVNDVVSLRSLKYFSDISKQYAPTALRVLLGTKSDMMTDVTVLEETNFASEYECDDGLVFRITSKSGDSIRWAFTEIVRKLLQKSEGLQQDSLKSGFIVLPPDKDKRRRPKCCKS